MNSQTAQDLLLDAMDEKAVSMHLNGVGVCFVLDPEDDSNRMCPGIVIVGAFHRGPKPERGPKDKGANYMCVAFDKLAQMLRLWEDSGKKAVKGEFNYKGGIIRDVAGRKVLVAFSGGTEVQDLEIAEYAIRSLSDDVLFRGWGEEHVSGMLLIMSMVG